MTQTEYDIAVQELTVLADGIVKAKRPDYTRESPDVLSNFKVSGDMAGITPLQAWAVHYYKQMSAIFRFAKNPTCNPSEPIASRFADARNYIDLGYALYRDTTIKNPDIIVRVDS